MNPNILPPIPAYDALHPIVVHFPIALLLVMPLFAVLAVFTKSQARGLMTAAFVLSVIGTASAFLATSTGEATEGFAKGIASAQETLSRHEDLAELARNLYVGVTVVVGVIAAAFWLKGDKLGLAGRIAAAAVIVVLAAAPAAVLANAAHLGGQLVHVHGVHAPIKPTGVSQSASGQTSQPKSSGYSDDRD